MKLAFETDGGVGTRANLGVIVLETDETLEHEFRQIFTAPDIGLYVSRIAMAQHVTSDTLAQMLDDIPGSARLLPTALQFDAVGYCCTSAATVIGPDAVAQAVQQGCPGAQVTNPITAILAACHAVGAQRLGFVTPYVPEVSAKMRALLEQDGFEIVSFGSFEESNDRVVAKIAPASILSAITTVAAQADCDAVVVACTNLRCLAVMAEAEARTGVPVIASNPALAWHMLRLAGIDLKRPELGRLWGEPG